MRDILNGRLGLVGRSARAVGFAAMTLNLDAGAATARLKTVDELRQVRAAAITVTTTGDVVNPGDGLTSLREAIIVANGTGAADRILLPAGTCPISINGT